MAPEAEPDHERGHDDRDRVDPDAALQGQDPLPDDLADEGGGAAQEEKETGDERARWQGDRILSVVRSFPKRPRMNDLHDRTQIS